VVDPDVVGGVHLTLSRSPPRRRRRIGLLDEAVADRQVAMMTL
jgi:hypothetical protein